MLVDCANFICMPTYSIVQLRSYPLLHTVVFLPTRNVLLMYTCKYIRIYVVIYVSAHCMHLLYLTIIIVIYFL